VTNGKIQIDGEGILKYGSPSFHVTRYFECPCLRAKCRQAVSRLWQVDEKDDNDQVSMMAHRIVGVPPKKDSDRDSKEKK